MNDRLKSGQALKAVSFARRGGRNGLKNIRGYRVEVYKAIIGHGYSCDLGERFTLEK